MEFLWICLTSFQRAFKMHMVHFDQHPVLLWKARDCKRKWMCLWSVAETSCEESTRCLSKCLHEPDYLLVFVSRCIHSSVSRLSIKSLKHPERVHSWLLHSNSYDPVPFHRAHTVTVSATDDSCRHKATENDLVARRHHVLHPLETSEPIEAKFDV